MIADQAGGEEWLDRRVSPGPGQRGAADVYMRLTRVYMTKTIGNRAAQKWGEFAPILAFRVYLKFT